MGPEEISDIVGVNVTRRPPERDSEHLDLHLVSSVQLARFKAGIVADVTAKCGKKWAPKFPIRNMSRLPRCPVCFPVEKHRFAPAS